MICMHMPESDGLGWPCAFTRGGLLTLFRGNVALEDAI